MKPPTLLSTSPFDDLTQPPTTPPLSRKRATLMVGGVLCSLIGCGDASDEKEGGDGGSGGTQTNAGGTQANAGGTPSPPPMIAPGGAAGNGFTVAPMVPPGGAGAGGTAAGAGGEAGDAGAGGLIPPMPPPMVLPQGGQAGSGG